VVRLDAGELPVADHGLIGDGCGWALVGRDGAIGQMSLPEIGSPSLFSGRSEFVVAPGQVLESRQYYLADTAVLVTEMRCPTGVVEVTDTFTLRSGADLAEDSSAARGELLRYVRVLEGWASVRIAVRPAETTDVRRVPGGVRLRGGAGESELDLLAGCRLEGPRTTVDLQVGDEQWLLLRWGPRLHRTHHVQPRRLLEQTATVWRRWSAGISYDGPEADAVRRSALTVKLLGCTDPGDAACLGSTLRRIGLAADADHVLGGVLDAVQDNDKLPGTDGDILDCAFQWAADGGPVHDELWSRLVSLAEPAVPVTDTYSAAMYHVALDRAASLGTSLHMPGETAAWSARAATVRDRILREAWDDRRQSLTGRLGPGGDLDPRLLALPARHVLPAGHPRMVATVQAIAGRLGATPETVLAHSFWLVDNLVAQGRIEEAGDTYEALCACANPLGLLPELIDTADGSFLGEFPHTSSHVAVIATGVALARALHGDRIDIAGARQ
jgi:alpha,alpha-trehalase